jgi:hypothetical protein
VGAGAARSAKSSSLSFVESVSRDLRYLRTSEPERKRVDEDELAWTAKGVVVDEMVESTTVVTREKLSLVRDRGDTTQTRQ